MRNLPTFTNFAYPPAQSRLLAATIRPEVIAAVLWAGAIVYFTLGIYAWSKLEDVARREDPTLLALVQFTVMGKLGRALMVLFWPFWALPWFARSFFSSFRLTAQEPEATTF